MGDISHEAGTVPIVVALGGNTLLGEHGLGTIDEQLDVIARTTRQISDAIQAGYDVVLTHGNGQALKMTCSCERTTGCSSGPRATNGS